MASNRTGGCPCGTVRYTLTAPPLVVNCCHCNLCKKQTGVAFTTNIIIEASHFVLDLSTPPLLSVAVDTPSGNGQLRKHCPKCLTCVVSEYGGSFGGPFIQYVKIGTLDPEFQAGIRPDAFVFVKEKLNWIGLPEGARAFPEFYDFAKGGVWSEESIKRREKLLPQINEWVEKGEKFKVGEIY
ncbi:hypothetical protein EJ06DRAFT_529012 [Trichodelitschia bisporula]|uniref:CENP-V/GFA domain-containing protein n=1 Tax=Trichodelitschia bisporula TaxID=703511 RepID=A0A6G1I0N2_9PEZI|nr:hypothetical protein EJ06DRAFT_529012 [Trichodelitschia bisporula]